MKQNMESSSRRPSNNRSSLLYTESERPSYQLPAILLRALRIERTLFYFVCVGDLGVFNLFNSLITGVVVFFRGFTFGRWVTNADPAFLRILAKS